ncbi:helix-turn-helix transcriptional regulator [Thermoactinospora rubra]|uniref:helix-turn-helix transcriptional regulator n=1 Tax=Thermoactinospora rubra TaxID=1088767 RepID=UPI000A10DBC7|nr:HTH domain-containing protein [Thermoactinospora rubra]
MRYVDDERSGGARSERAAERPVAPATGRRRLILTMLRESGSPLSVADIAERLGVHPNTARFHLDALAETGQVERVHAVPSGPGRPPLAYRARPGMDRGGPRSYRLLAEILAGNLAADPEPVTRAIEAGRAWGGFLVDRPSPSEEVTRQAAVQRLVRLLDDLGFAPDEGPSEGPAGGPAQIGLRHCPFLELVGTQGKVICPLHLGLMQGAMAAIGAPVTVDRLDPFARPDLCLAHLATADGAR